MLVVSGTPFDVSTIAKNYVDNSVEMQLLNKMAESTETYRYDNLSQLEFELNLRKEIVNSAVNLNDSGLDFSDFKYSKCNPAYWQRTATGGFLLKEGVKSSKAINDIFANGEDYATECATAMMIVYYKALLNVYGDDLFNKLFPEIYLMGWNIREPLLAEVGTPQPVADMLLGDRGYFNNLDYDPDTPEWEGENVIVLPDSLYYGHGIGITTANTIIEDLNSRRKEGATRSAYFLNEAGRPDFKKLSSVYGSSHTQTAPLVWRPFPPPIILT